MISLNYDTSEKFVSDSQNDGVNVRWDGWNIVFFKEDRKALRSVKGRRLGRKWGFETVVRPDSMGRWNIPHRVVREAKSARR